MNENGPKHPLLDSITHRFEQNQLERKQKEDAFFVKRSVEKAHSEYIQKNLVTPHELSRAAVPVAHYAKKNGMKSGSTLLEGPPRQQRTTTSSLINSARNQFRVPQSVGRGDQSTQVGADAGRQTERMEVNTDAQRSETPGRSMSTAIDLDLSQDDVELMEIQECIDISNNSAMTTTDSSSSEFSCKVLNCDAVFSSDGRLGQHMSLFQHSPCNPCLKAKDCKLLPNPLCYVCPDCDCEFTQSEDCKAHMQSEQHSIFLPPLKISAYMCPQCLYLFENFESCWNHMEKSSHQAVCYPFIDDHGVGATGPVAVPEELVQDLVRQCRDVKFTVQCLECSMIVDSPLMLHTHWMETNNMHVVSALTDTNLVDVFAGYLSRYSCDVCHRLFNGSVTMLAGHQCATGIMGRIADNDTTSFAQFVKRCALSFVKSLEPVPGPSYQSRQAAYSPSRNLRGGSMERSGENSGKTVSNIRKNSLIVLDGSDDDDDKGAGGRDACASASQDRNRPNMPDVIHIDSDMDSPVVVAPKRKARSPNENKSKKVAKPRIMVTSPNSSETDLTSGSNPAPKRKSRFEPMQPGSAPEKHNSNYLFLSMGPNSMTTGQQWGGPAVAGPSSLPNQIVPPVVLPQMGNNPRPGPSQPDNRRRHYSGPSGQQRDRDKYGRDSRSNRLSGDRPRSRSRSRSPLHNSMPPAAVTSSVGGTVGLGENLISKEHLSQMSQIIFLDLDNWPGFFTKLPRVLPHHTFVWGFYGGKNVWREPRSCWLFQEMKRRGQFYLHERCGRTKDAADVAIVMMVTMMHKTLPDNVAFTIVSGDQAFLEVQRQMRHETRTAIVINPHLAQKKSPDMMYVMVTSVTDT